MVSISQRKAEVEKQLVALDESLEASQKVLKDTLQKRDMPPPFPQGLSQKESHDIAEKIHSLLTTADEHVSRGNHRHAIIAYNEAKAHFAQHQHKLQEHKGDLHTRLNHVFERITAAQRQKAARLVLQDGKKINSEKSSVSIETNKNDMPPPFPGLSKKENEETVSKIHALLTSAHEHAKLGNNARAIIAYGEAKARFDKHQHKLGQEHKSALHRRFNDVFEKIKGEQSDHARKQTTGKKQEEIKQDPLVTSSLLPQQKAEESLPTKEPDLPASAVLVAPEAKELIAKEIGSSLEPDEGAQKAEFLHKMLEKIEGHLKEGKHENAKGLYSQARNHFVEHRGKLKRADAEHIHERLKVLFDQLNKSKMKDLNMVPMDKKDLGDARLIDSYDFNAGEIPITVNIYKTDEEYVPIYQVSIQNISKNTEIILERIRNELINQVNIGMIEITETKKTAIVENRFKDAIKVLIKKYFPDLDETTLSFLAAYLVMRSLGLGKVEILMADERLEEITINSGTAEIWVFQKKYGWLKTNIKLDTEDQVRHYSAMIARKVGRQISILEPLLDAHLSEGDRVNATLMPISSAGNTITIRKFSKDQFTITKFLKFRTITTSAAALIWTAMQYEMSALIAGGTASGKTSALNVLACFFPPNQRIISIEDTREIRLPSFLHWVPMQTRLPNSEGKGEVSMSDLLVNALRQRPDRILVGEVRRAREAETLFEAIHTGHSVYATFHANNVAETINRLLNPPINVPKTMLPAISLIIMQFRNRRTGLRRTFQIAEITEDAEANTILQYDQKKDMLVKKNESKSFYDNLRLYTGYSDQEINQDFAEKESVLKYLMDQNIESVDGVGRVIAEYYINKDNIMKHVNKNAPFEKAIRNG